MKLFTDDMLILNLIQKLEKQTLFPLEHDYLQKALLASTLIQSYKNSLDFEEGKLLIRYYRWLVAHFYDPQYSQKELTQYFLLKVQLENYFSRFGIEIGNEKIKSASYFDQVKYIAQIWGYNLTPHIDNILEFFSFFAPAFFGVPNSYTKEIINLIKSPWKPVLAPLGMITQKRFYLEEIERYFFGNDEPPLLNTHVVSEIDRLFSIKNPLIKNHIFLPKEDNFDLFEASLVVHEIQHIQDPYDENLFLSERNALNSERTFLQIMGSGKRGKYCWLESNLLYPLVLLKWEIETILTGVSSMPKFHRLCGEHGLKTITLSPLFDWGTPFHMSTYCAATMDIEQNWQHFLRDGKEACVNA